VIRFLKAIVLSLGFAVATAAQAAGPVTVSPAAVSINDAGATVVTLRWQVGVTSSFPATISVSSATGTLAIGGFAGGALTRVVQHPGGGPITITFIERLRLDRTTAKRISQVGTTTYSRVFTDINGSSTVVSVALQSTGGGALSTRNFSLRFDDETSARVVGKNAALSARLNLTTNGNGVFAGAWEVAGPSASQGGFRPIKRIRRVLAGSRRTIFESPALPTDRAGVYRVRFVTNSGVPRGAGEVVPVLTYTVTNTATAPGLDLLAPQAGSELSAATRFRWRPVAGATRYRVEFLGADAGSTVASRIAALDVTATATSLRAFTLRRLATHSTVYWRVIAFDAQGALIANSPLRRVR